MRGRARAKRRSSFFTQFTGISLFCLYSLSEMACCSHMRTEPLLPPPPLQLAPRDMPILSLLAITRLPHLCYTPNPSRRPRHTASPASNLNQSSVLQQIGYTGTSGSHWTPPLQNFHRRDHYHCAQDASADPRCKRVGYYASVPAIEIQGEKCIQMQGVLTGGTPWAISHLRPLPNIFEIFCLN
jgi:hypothetical protein